MKIDRRNFIKSLALSSSIIAGSQLSFAQETKNAAKLGKAKSIIQVWLWGGPSHLETFDPKPNAGVDYCGPLNNPLPTKTDSLMLCQHLPELAKLSDLYCAIRSVTHSTNAHETAAYLVQTGRLPDKDVYPAIGAVISKLRGYDAGYKGTIPPYIVLTKPLGRFSENGFLPAKYKPFATGGNPSQTIFAVEGIVAPDMSRAMQNDRKKLLDTLNTYKKAVKNNPKMELANLSMEQAYDMILGDTGKVFDLEIEGNKIRDNYGRNLTGQSCLAARKLVEAGVPYITLNLGGWDTHKLHFEAMAKMLPQLDKAISALLIDLKERGLLDTTIVWVGGEFGRTPKLSMQAPFSGGRGHYGEAFSVMLAGGGIKGGTVIGSTDAKGEFVESRPVHPADIIATLYNQMGIDPYSTIKNPRNEDVVLVEKIKDKNLSEGMLYEVI